MKNFRTYQLALKFYQLTRNKKLPSHLSDQFKRASSSIALNLAEGYGKRTTKDRTRFFSIALGSAREVQAITSLEPEHFTLGEIDLLDHLAASNYNLIRPPRG